MKRLCLLGPESTGKTRLVETLAAHFNAETMPEYGRYFDIFRKQGEDGAAQGEDWTEADILRLAETHIAMREALALADGELMIEDTDIIQTAIWAEYLLGAPAPTLERRMRAAEFADHYLVLSPDVAWVDDGVRYAGDDSVRKWFFDQAVARLKALRLPFDIVVGDNWDKRTAAAIVFAEKRFGAPPRT